jgi:two-component system chemotaxis response regulator CheB
MSGIVVIGGSTGAMRAIGEIVGGISDDFPAPICIALHIGASPSQLPRLVGSKSKVSVEFASDGEALKPGHVRIAPPDHHLLVEDGHLHLSRGPRENFARPAIDPLFRTAALAYGTGTFAALLSGRLNDGTPGLYDVKRHGGTTIVQDPGTAEVGDMIDSALANVAIDYCLAPQDIAPLLSGLLRHKSFDQPVIEVSAMNKGADLSSPLALTCPECGGAMRQIERGSLTEYRCHIGHRMTEDVLGQAQATLIDETFERLRRQLNERIEYADKAKSHAESRHDLMLAEDWRAEREAAEARLHALQRLFRQN